MVTARLGALVLVVLALCASSFAAVPHKNEGGPVMGALRRLLAATGIAQNGPAALAAKNEALLDAFNRIERRADSSSRIRRGTRAQREAEQPAQGFAHGVASVLYALPKLARFVSGQKRTHSAPSADLDAARVALIKQRGKEARAALLRTVQAAAPQTARAAARRDNSTLCNAGVATESSQLLNTCGTNRVCRVTAFTTTGSSSATITTAASVFLNNESFDITKMQCDGLPVDLVADHGASHCHVTKLGCSEDTALADCDVAVLCSEPEYLAFGLGDGIFAYRCSTDALVCNGTTVDNPAEYSGEVLPPNCSVQRAPCDAASMCFGLSVADENSTLQIDSALPCALSCVRTVNGTQCQCPADYTGTQCDEPVPIKCSAYLVAPLPSCITSAADNMLVYDKPCLVYDGLAGARLEMSWRISCQFADAQRVVSDSNSSNFTYWLDTPNLRLSSEPEWVARISAYQFTKLHSDSRAAVNSSTKLTRAQILGEEPVVLAITPSEQFVVGGRVYAELAFDSAAAPPGMEGAVLRRFHLDDRKGGFGGGDGGREIGAGLGAGETAGTVVGCVVGVIIIAGIAWYLWKRCRDPHKQKSKKNKAEKQD